MPEDPPNPNLHQEHPNLLKTGILLYHKIATNR